MTKIPFAYLTALQAAVAQTAHAGPATEKLAQSLGQVLADFEAAAPEMTVVIVNDMISGAAAKSPLLGFLVPAEAAIDPLVKGLSGQLEAWALGKAGLS